MPSLGSTRVASPEPVVAGPDYAPRHAARRRSPFGVRVWLVVLGAVTVAFGAWPGVLFLWDRTWLSHDAPAPSPLALPLLILAGFLAGQLIRRAPASRAADALLLFGTGVIAGLVWLALEPTWRLGHWWSLYGSALIAYKPGYVLIPVMGAGFWAIGMAWAVDQSLLATTGARRAVLAAGVGLAAFELLSALVHAYAPAAHALRVAPLCVLGLLLFGVAFMAFAGLRESRSIAAERGSKVPSWREGGAVVASTAMVLLLLTLVVTLLFGAGALGAIGQAIGDAWARLMHLLFGWLSHAPTQPPPPPVRPPSKDKLPEQTDGDPSNGPDASQWLDDTRIGVTAGIIIALFIAWLILSRLRKTQRIQMSMLDDTGDASREGIFSRKLLRDQLRDLFRRGPRDEPRRIDLDATPADAREAMLWLQALALRRGAGRAPAETAVDFVTRLERQWPQQAEPLGRLGACYDPRRYDDRTDRDAEAVTAWQDVYAGLREQRTGR